MKRACIAVVDAARACIYSYEEDANPGEELRATRELVNEARRLKAGDLFSEARSSYGDPDTKFAKEIIEEIDKVVRDEKLVYCVLIAPPKMLGTLRKYNAILHREDLLTHEVSRDLTTVSRAQLHDQLAALDILAPRQRLKIAR